MEEVNGPRNGEPRQERSRARRIARASATGAEFGEPSPPPRPSAPTRRRILLAAMELIADVGWGGVTTRLVAERSGANSALVHYYFGSKAALLTEAATAALTGEFQAAVETIVRAGSLAEGLIAVLAQFSAYDVDSRPGRLVMEVMAQSLREPGLRQAMVDLLRDTRGQLAARAAKEMPAGVDPVGASILLAALLDGIGLHRLLDPALDLERATAVLRAVAKRGSNYADNQRTNATAVPDAGTAARDREDLR